MKTKSFKGLVLFLGLGLLLSFSTSVAWGFMEEGTLRVGFVTITSGVGSGYGIQIGNNLAIAIDEINSAGGVRIGNKNVKIEMAPYIRDSGRVPTQAVAMVRNLMERDNVLFIYGPQSSAESEVLFGTLQKRVDDPKDTGSQIVLFGCGASMPGLADLSDWAFRNVSLESIVIDKTLGILIPTYNIKTVGALVQRDDASCYGSWKMAVEPAIKKYGLTLVGYEECLQGDRDFSPQIAKLKRANPDLWTNVTLYMLTARSLVDAKRAGFKPKAVMGYIGTVDPRLIESARDAAEGFLVGSPFHEGCTKAKPVVTKFRNITGLEMNIFGANAYEAMYMTKWAIENSDIKNIPETIKEDRRKFRDALLRIKNFDGLCGKINMMPNGDADRESKILVVKDKKFDLWQKP